MVGRFLAAAAQYPVSALADWPAYVAKLTGWVEDAAGRGARLLVFPEYGAMELASLEPETMGDLTGSLASVSALLPQVDALHRQLAMRLGVVILAASAPCRLADGRYVNRARLFTPGGAMGWQDKRVMTRFEREQWGVSGGAGLRVFDTALGRIGIAICYDSEFPLIARALVEAGAELLLVPSCTDTAQGYARVRIGAQARALEGQCLVVHSPTVGEAEWSAAMDVNRGAAGIYAPPDGPFPADGIVAMGTMDTPQWLLGEIDLAAVARLRCNGAVLNWRDWAEQPGAAALPAAEVVTLA